MEKLVKLLVTKTKDGFTIDLHTKDHKWAGFSTGYSLEDLFKKIERMLENE